MKNELDISGGTTRMESAFGSGDGDDEATASVAQKAEVKASIYEQTYLSLIHISEPTRRI